MSKEEKHVLFKKIDDNKDERERKAREDGKDWCSFGSHAVEKEEMIFCAVEELGLQRCIPGQQKHNACINHFSRFIVPHHNRGLNSRCFNFETVF